MVLTDTEIAVLGAGTSGFAAARLAAERGGRVTVFDSGDPEKLESRVSDFEGIGVNLVCGQAALEPTSQFDLSVVSPGIDLASPLATAFASCSTEQIGEVELAFRIDDTPLIAITGTNGKTTTTSLVADMLRGGGVRAVAAGNIGYAYCDVARSEKDLEWIVLEVSSFQLESICDFKPRVAVWMNFAPDHMDRYRSVEEYREAKMRIFRNVDEDVTVIQKWEDLPHAGQSVTFSAFSGEAEFTFDDGRIVHRPTGREFFFRDCHLHGKHNAENVMVALAVADELGLSWNAVARPIENFRAPAHRCEKVRVLDDVTWINDSKSTNLHSLESALAGLDEPTVLIAGGKRKGLDFSTLLPRLEGVKSAICFGEIGTEIAGQWCDHTRTEVADSLEEAVSAARVQAAPGDVVLFSPGTSSFDMFSGYEARGDAFRTVVESLDPRRTHPPTTTP